ncbi:2-oxoglutarate (2OG) and Fe(II)-dependent oxygenase superfamily protein [Striga asiatica]|uniref:2-oxoglutarate (2OG) and Fe(II)-dependent oxygenase superfamily protein n=1 Tax=Striga asiatica TaxID=4170 RepID=A0A5A7RJF3_STRAF|nr:2-oxoglutarate (2OG) and Fe(II)-dependent oxygenase superfamily protein [Striga asiatica]
MASTGGNMQRVETGFVLRPNPFFCGVRQQLLHHINEPFLGCREKGSLSQLVHLVHDSCPNFGNLSIEIRSSQSLKHLLVDFPQYLPHGGHVTLLRRQVELRVVVPARHLLHTTRAFPEVDTTKALPEFEDASDLFEFDTTSAGARGDGDGEGDGGSMLTPISRSLSPAQQKSTIVKNKHTRTHKNCDSAGGAEN